MDDELLQDQLLRFKSLLVAMTQDILAVLHRWQTEQAETIATLTAALEAVEWVFDPVLEELQCPWCKKYKCQGHAPDCLRQAALKKTRGES